MNADRWLVPAPAEPVATRTVDAGNSIGAPEPQVCWVGAHGGAGTSTLQAAAGVGLDCGRCPPPAPSPPAAGQQVLLVARTHAHGLAAVRRHLGAHGPVSVHGVALVADAPGRLPRDLRQQVRVLTGAAPRLWQVPWVEAWRTAPGATPPRPVADLLAQMTRPTITGTTAPRRRENPR